MRGVLQDYMLMHKDILVAHIRLDSVTASIVAVVRLIYPARHEEQIKLVNSFDWLELDRLTGIEDEFRELTKGSVFIEENRSTALCRALKQRVKQLEKIVDSHHSYYGIDNSANDVKEDIAYRG